MIVRGYALAAACFGVVMLVHVSALDELFHPMALFILAVVTAAWFGGPGPGVFAALLAGLALPHLVSETYRFSTTYPLLAGAFDLPRFIALALAGAAVGFGTHAHRRTEGALRQRERELSKVRDELEAAVAARTAELAASEARYARAMEATEAGHWEWDLGANVVFHSARFRELYAVPVEEKFATREDWKARQPVSALERERQERALQEAIADPAKRYDIELSFEIRPGVVRWLRSRAKVFRAEDGRPLRVTGATTDITAQKLAEEELRARTEMLEVAQKAARAVPWEWRNGADPAVNRWSPELCAMFGLPPGGFDGTARAWWQLCHPDDWARVRESIAHAHATGEVDIEYRVANTDGKVRWLHQKGRAFLDTNGKPVRSIGFMFDVTERHKFDDDLRSRQEMLELAQKAARAIAFEWKFGEGEGENRWSTDLEAMYGFARGSYDGSFDAWKKVVHPADWPAVNVAISLAEQTGEVASEYRVVHPDGSVHWLQARGRVFSGAGGKPARMVGFMQDVTERKRGEEELHKLELKLRRAQRLEAMGTLAGGIAHDFNNILGAILGYGEMAMRGAKKGSRLRRDVEAILAAGERGRALVDRILAFSRSGVGERVPVHVEAVVREALDQLAAKLPPNVTIMPRLHAGRAAMLGDSTQVHQVVMNLATNAMHAMPEGGVLRVSLDVERFANARAAAIGTVGPGEYLALGVKDSGIGIAPEVLERMFDPFYTTKDVGVGSGLGLSLVHGIVANVGGAIDVATHIGKGSTFTVYLPRSGNAPRKVSNEDRPLPRGAGQRVLVVDDEEPLARLAAETLERLGYAPVSFTSSNAALTAFRAAPQGFDAVLTDERMPGLSGSALIREMRGIRDTIPVVLMSGYVAMHTGEANIVVRKPLSARELAGSMARALQPGLVTPVTKLQRPALR
jgi:PAS domain S-box-containing protein